MATFTPKNKSSQASFTPKTKSVTVFTLLNHSDIQQLGQFDSGFFDQSNFDTLVASITTNWTLVTKETL